MTREGFDDGLQALGYAPNALRGRWERPADKFNGRSYISFDAITGLVDNFGCDAGEMFRTLLEQITGEIVEPGAVDRLADLAS